ncbi:MAG TPA: DUF1634 domain-containing protein [Burkholderiales bacterium]|jgi:uncharacterized membrane protein|nr:DUF1634 domain-containing protein [Burkholderiales bacterium]
MSDQRTGWTEQKIEQGIGNLLRVGVIIAAAVVVVGGAVYLIHHGREMPHYRIFRGEPADLRSFSGILRDCLQWRGTGLIEFGLLLLLATPVARVIFSMIAFAMQRDRVYVAVTLVVLSILLYSIAGGRM